MNATSAGKGQLAGEADDSGRPAKKREKKMFGN
jgi:hypothetical protein